MDREKRLLENLDQIDKHINAASMTLFVASLLYIALLLNVSPTLKIPGFDLNLPKAYALFIGCPLMLVVFQYITIAALAMLRVEESLASVRLNPHDPPVRTPTVFSMMFLARETAEARHSRAVLLFHIIVVFSCLYLLPLATCAAMSLWLVKHSSRSLSAIAVVCALGCLAEIIFVAVASARRLKATTNPSLKR